MEIWKSIKGYEGVYEVSDLGRIKSLERLSFNGSNYIRKEMILSPIISTNGYYCVNLYKDKKPKYNCIHILVANQFINKTANYVNHKDLNKLNNTLENLEFVTNRGNSYHYHLLMGRVPGVIKIGNKYQVRIRINGIKEYFGRFCTISKAIEVRDLAIENNSLGIYK